MSIAPLITDHWPLATGAQVGDLSAVLLACLAGSEHDHLHAELRRCADLLGRQSGALAVGESFFTGPGFLRPEMQRAHCPGQAAGFAVRDNRALEATVLLAEGVNAAMDTSLPAPMNMVLRRPFRPAFRKFSTVDAASYVHPYRYQVLSRDRSAAWQSASPKALTPEAIGAPAEVSVPGTVVIVQDRFSQENFAHFLFDGVTRVLHYLQYGHGDPGTLFVFGGSPGPYHALLCEVLCATTGLQPGQLLFPRQAMLLTATRRTHWFSDQVDDYTHPAQMAHPASVAALRRFAEALPAASSVVRRLYISRADAARRRLANEPALAAALAGRGFHCVQLAALDVPTQLGLFRGAEIIVAPHGMGLAHLALAPSGARVLELFPPDAGSDAYALFARAAGLEHRFLVGIAAAQAPGDFVVDVAQVMAALDAWLPA